MNLYYAVGLPLTLTTIAIALYIFTARRYQSSDSVANSKELMRVLKPGGVLVMADWNQRDDRQKPLNAWERSVMQQLLDQWSHQAFASIEGFSELLAETGLVEGEVITADWTGETLPSWLDSIWQGIARPQGLIQFWVSGLIKSLQTLQVVFLTF